MPKVISTPTRIANMELKEIRAVTKGRGYEVRFLNFDDVQDILNLAELHISELQNHLPYERVVLEELITRTMALLHNWYYFGVFDDKGTLIGYAQCTKEPYFFNRSFYFLCHSMYVRKERRNGFIAKTLIQHIEDCASALGCLESFLGVTHGYDHKKVLRFFGLLGYSEMGGVYRKSL